jgi:hypothetical protein
MGARTRWCAAALAAAGVAGLFSGEVRGASPPQVCSVIEGRDTASERPVLVMLGKGLTKFSAYSLRNGFGEEVAAVDLLLRGKTMLVLGLPPDLAPGRYALVATWAKTQEMAFNVDVGNGAPMPASVDLAALAESLRTDLSDAETLQGLAPSHFLDSSNQAAGTLSTDRFSARADLEAEGAVGEGAVQVARGDHHHDGRYPASTVLASPGTLNDAGNPVDWSRLKGVPAGFADGVDDRGEFTAGAGLDLEGTVFSVLFAGTGAAPTAARSDHDHGSVYALLAHDHDAAYATTSHDHDGRYFTEAEADARFPLRADLGDAGTINQAGNPVHWTRLQGVPAGFADGTDEDTTYSAGTGLALAGTSFSVNYSGTGAADLAARSDHTHTGIANAVAVTGNVAGTLLSGVNSSTTAGISGVFGQSSAGTGSTYGVHGASNTSNGCGVYGTGAYGVYGSGDSYGLYGAGGSYGTYGSGGTYGAYGSGSSYGVYGTASTYGVFGSSGSYGVRGDSTSSGYGVWGTSGFLGAYGNASSGTYGLYGGGGTYGVYGSGTSYGVYCSGNFAASGTKSFVQKHPEDPTKAIVYVCLEGGESGTYCRGSGRLVEGEARIDLPAHFPLVTSPDGITAQVTPTAECRGLYVAAKNHRFLIVRELGGGASGATFDWTVNGVRAGHEHHEPISSDPGLVRALNNEGGTPEAIAGLPPRQEPEPPAPVVPPPAPRPAR